MRRSSAKPFTSSAPRASDSTSAGSASSTADQSSASRHLRVSFSGSGRGGGSQFASGSSGSTPRADSPSAATVSAAGQGATSPPHMQRASSSTSPQRARTCRGHGSRTRRRGSSSSVSSPATRRPDFRATAASTARAVPGHREPGGLRLARGEPDQAARLRPRDLARVERTADGGEPLEAVDHVSEGLELPRREAEPLPRVVTEPGEAEVVMVAASEEGAGEAPEDPPAARLLAGEAAKVAVERGGGGIEPGRAREVGRVGGREDAHLR
jgi:hypothetical protein